ncbi:MAG TPA: aryl-sulfate sulfotransferase [Gammaproteobacteria bacterium]
MTANASANRSFVILLIGWLLTAVPVAGGQEAPASSADTEQRGIRLVTPEATPGYTLLAPLNSYVTYLIDLEGRVVRTWTSDFLSGAWVYMLDNGHVLRGGREPETHGFFGGGQGGRFQQFDLDGNLVWDFSLNTADRLPHHDVAVLPNGNIVAVVWERKSAEEARRAGRRPEFIPPDGVWGDVLIELEPQPPHGARIVWEWHAWDHLVQDIDPSLEGYGDPADHPELIDVNGDTIGMTEPPEQPIRDIFHINSVAYSPELDQLIISSPTFNEIWVIDHSTTTEEAASGHGGRSGVGGRLLYRWGNPQVYRRGGEADRKLGFQHDARWIPEGRPGAGNITVFSNRTPSPTGSYTQVYEIAPPVDGQGRYRLPANGPFGPQDPVWTYSARDTLHATFISGAERLSSGNTLISSGPQGRIFEVRPDGTIVWEYWSPFCGTRSGTATARANPFSLFRATRVPPDHPGLVGRDLSPLSPQPPIDAARDRNAGAAGGDRAACN